MVDVERATRSQLEQAVIGFGSYYKKEEVKKWSRHDLEECIFYNTCIDDPTDDLYEFNGEGH